MRGKILPLRRGEDVLSSISDEQLVALCAARDTAALATLFDRHSKDLYRFVVCLSGANIRDLDDIVQETFLTLFNGAGGFKGKSQVKTWLFGIAVNVARHNARAETRRKLFGLRYAELEFQSPHLPDHAVIWKQHASLLQEALSQLTHDQRAAFVMCEIEGLCGAEAATALNIPQGTLFRRLHDARKKLLSLLAGALT